MKFRLVHPIARQRAIDAVKDAPEGWEVTVKEPTRNGEQNALLWVCLQKFSDQLVWPVNGVMCKLTPEEWKDLLTSAYKKEVRLAAGIDGGMVMLGMRTSKMGKRQMAEFLDFVQSVAADRGVEL